MKLDPQRLARLTDAAAFFDGVGARRRDSPARPSSAAAVIAAARRDRGDAGTAIDRLLMRAKEIRALLLEGTSAR